MFVFPSGLPGTVNCDQDMGFENAVSVIYFPMGESQTLHLCTSFAWLRFLCLISFYTKHAQAKKWRPEMWARAGRMQPLFLRTRVRIWADKNIFFARFFFSFLIPFRWKFVERFVLLGRCGPRQWKFESRYAWSSKNFKPTQQWNVWLSLCFK